MIMIIMISLFTCPAIKRGAPMIYIILKGIGLFRFLYKVQTSVLYERLKLIAKSMIESNSLHANAHEIQFENDHLFFDYKAALSGSSFFFEN